MQGLSHKNGTNKTRAKKNRQMGPIERNYLEPDCIALAGYTFTLLGFTLVFQLNCIRLLLSYLEYGKKEEWTPRTDEGGCIGGVEAHSKPCQSNN